MSRLLSHRPELVAFAETAESVAAAFLVDPEHGLSQVEAMRRQTLGINTLRATETLSAWRIFIEQFKTLIVWLLLGASGLSYLFGDALEAGAILLVIVLNAFIGFGTELRGVRSMEALRKIAARTTKVRRDGKLHEIPASEVVLGDVVQLEAGDVVTADLRLLESADLHADESTLTGESVPVSKSVEPLPTKQPLADRFNMVWKGTSITSGTGLALATAVGMGTELGRITALVDEAKSESTPLERRLEQLSRQLVWVTLILIVVIIACGVVSGHRLHTMIEMAVALAVASFPEGLPMVTTVALARGMWRLAKKNVLIERLSAVETLGATTLVCADKTGTLTENRMTVVRYAFENGEVEVEPETGRFTRDGRALAPGEDVVLADALRIGLLCANAELDPVDPKAPGVGDPMELALARAAAGAGLHRVRLLEQYEELEEESFSATTRMMATIHHAETGRLVQVKGAPEAVLAASTKQHSPAGAIALGAEERARWAARAEGMAEGGLRVLGLAQKVVGAGDLAPYEDLVFVGLVGLWDPPRVDAKLAVTGFRQAGIRVAMITGDHARTAAAIARALDLSGDEAPVVVEGRALANAGADAARASIYARVSPEQKLELVEFHQKRGEVVAMTGDGVNDAPALEKADIGVAMGLRGTEVAKEAADVVLRDDRFSSILEAVFQGRVIFENIRRFVIYLLSCNLSEIMVVGLCTLLGLPLPLLPLQILFLNLVTDVFPALALGVGEGDDQVMKRPPRDPKERFLTRAHWVSIVVQAAVIAGSTMLALYLVRSRYGLNAREATTISFLTLALAQTWHVLNLRAKGAPFWKNDILSNRHMWLATATCVVLTLAGLYVPLTQRVMKLKPPSLELWMLTLGMSLLPLLLARPLTSLILAAGPRPTHSATT